MTNPLLADLNSTPFYPDVEITPSELPGGIICVQNLYSIRSFFLLRRNRRLLWQNKNI